MHMGIFVKMHGNAFGVFRCCTYEQVCSILADEHGEQVEHGELHLPLLETIVCSIGIRVACRSHLS